MCIAATVILVASVLAAGRHPRIRHPRHVPDPPHPLRYRARPSLLLAAAKAAGTGAGALAAAAPARLRDAVVGGLQDALTEAYNEQLGELRRQGLSDDEPEVGVAGLGRAWLGPAAGPA